MTSDVEKKPASPREYILAKYDLNAASLLRAAPVALGEDATQYDLLLKAEIEQWRPRRPYDWVLVQQLVSAEWQLLQFPAVSALLLDAAIANTVHQQLAEAEALKMPAPKDRRGQNTAEQVLGVQLWLSLRQQAFSAVLGDNAAIALVEEKLGPGKLKVTAETASHLERTFRTQLQADRVIASTLTRCANVYKELERRALKRDEESLKRDEESLSAFSQRALQFSSISDYIRSTIKPAAAAKNAGPSAVSASAPDEAIAAPADNPPSVQAPDRAPSDAATQRTEYYVVRGQSLKDIFNSILGPTALAKDAAASAVSAAAPDDASAPPTAAADPPSVHPPDPPPSEVATPRTEEISAPQTDEVSAPQTDEVSARQTNEVSAPQTDEVSAPQTDEVSAPQTDEVSARQTNEVSAPQTDEVGAPQTDEVSAPQTDEVAK